MVLRYQYRQAPHAPLGGGHDPISATLRVAPIEAGTIEAPDHHAACEMLFLRHTLADRPEAATRRRMAVGDVLTFMPGPSAPLGTFVCGLHGFHHIGAFEIDLDVSALAIEAARERHGTVPVRILPPIP